MQEGTRVAAGTPTLLRHLLSQRYTLSYRRFCREYDKVAAKTDRTLVGTVPSESTYKRWLRGEVTRLPRWEACAVLDAMFPDHRLEDLFQPYRGADSNQAAQAELAQRRTLLDTALTQRQGGRLVTRSPAHLDEIVAHLREQWHALVRTDNLLGPRFAIPGVLNQIAVIDALCSGLRGEQRLEVIRLGAQYAESAAWLYEDAGDITQARYWTSRAMELAHEGDDVRMLAWTIFRRSQQAATALDTAQVIGLAQAARRNEEQLATPTRAAIRVQEAHGHALDGDEQAAHTLLDKAHTWAASDTTGDAHEGHGSYCTPSYIEIQRANCWLTIGNPGKAVTLYEESLATLPVVYERSRAAALSRLAVAYVAIGQIEHAASAAHAALPVARSGGSMRILDEVKGIGRKLAPHRKLHDVALLLDDLNSDGER